MNLKPLTCFFVLLLMLSVSWKRYPSEGENTFKEISGFVDDYIESYNKIQSQEINLWAYSLALKGFNNIKDKLDNDTLLTLIDYSLPSTEKRLYVIDLHNSKLIMKLHVAHGKNSGVNYAKKFSNKKGSNMTSLGFYITKNTYSGKHGYSLRLDGIEKANSNALDRAIVMHGAYYVSEKFIEQHGRLGRSFGCPAISYSVSERLINTIKNGTCIFVYYPKEDYISTSEVLMLDITKS